MGEQQELTERRFPPGVKVRARQNDDGQLDFESSPKVKKKRGRPKKVQRPPEEELPAVPADELPEEPPAPEPGTESDEEVEASAVLSRAERLEARRKKHAERQAAGEAPAYSDFTAIPPTEVMTELRDRPTVTHPPDDDEEDDTGDAEPAEEDDEIVGIGANRDLTSKKRFKPQCLADIHAEYSIDAERTIRVERTQPRQAMGVNIKGHLGNLAWPISDEEFTDIFGGGSYLLQVYGPAPMGRVGRDGKPRIKALTDRIQYDVPGDPTVDIPAAVFRGPGRRKSEDDDMSDSSLGLGRRPASSGDASVIASMIKSNESQSKRADDAQAARIAEVRAAADREASVAVNATQATVDLLREQLREARSEVSSERQRVEQLEQRMKAELERVRSASENQRRPDTEMISQMREMYTDSSSMTHREITRLNEEHSRALNRAEQDHQRMLDQVETRHREAHSIWERRLDDLRREKESALSELRSRFDDREREIRRDCEAKLQLERDRAEQQRATDKQMLEMQLGTEKNNWSGREGLLKQQIMTLQNQVSELNQKVASQEDLAARVEKFGDMASVLGYTKGEGTADSRDWKERAVDALAEAVKSLPEMTGEIRGALQARNTGLQLQQEMQMRAQQQQHLQQQHAAQQQLPPQQQAPQMAAAPPQQQQMVPQAQAAQAAQGTQRRIPTRANPQGFGGSGDPEAAPVAQRYEGGGTVVVGEPPASVQQHAQAPQPAQAQPAVEAPASPPAESGEEGAEAEAQPTAEEAELAEQTRQWNRVIDQLVAQLEPAYLNQVNVTQVVGDIYRQNDPTMVYGLAKQLTPEIITGRLEAAHPESELLSMTGQSFLKSASNAFMIIGEQVLTGAPG